MRHKTKVRAVKAGLGLAGILGLGYVYPIVIQKAFDNARENSPNLTERQAYRVFQDEVNKHFGGAGGNVHFNIHEDRDLRKAGYDNGYLGRNNKGEIELGLAESSLDKPSIVYLVYLARNYPEYLSNLGNFGRGKRSDIRELRKSRGRDVPLTSRSIDRLPNHLKSYFTGRNIIKPIAQLYTLRRKLF